MNPKILEYAGRLTVSGVPEGADALLLAEVSGLLSDQQQDRTLVHITRDDARLYPLADALAFFAPDLEVLTFPAWDCLPYDRISPNAALCSQRMRTLASLLVAKPSPKRIVLTTVNAVSQRVVSRETVKSSSFLARLGDQVDTEHLFTYLANKGYNRSATVMDPGEFAEIREVRRQLEKSGKLESTASDGVTGSLFGWISSAIKSLTDH